MHEDEVNSIAHDINQLQIGDGRGPLKGTKFQSPEKDHHNQKTDFVFSVRNQISFLESMHTNTGVAVIRLANKYPCPF